MRRVWTRTSTSSQEDKKLPKMTPLKHCIATIKPRQCQLTDAEICSMVLTNSNTSVSDSEESEEETQAENKMLIDSLVEVLNTAIKGLEQRDFISESDIMAIHKIKEKLLNQKPKLMKQLTLNEMFCKNVKIKKK
ncbi:hypothetical protein AVEN_227568-1 [Araneus ventricosus]|uniref:Uncharacterized protein n=1 Tax=Araneus ventricosus TaxID=182803 RepID=A0A4Y2C3N8_ARAVE|nr:hypothetical protein AVEN_227568-1 [Araneus ventricosus]